MPRKQVISKKATYQHYKETVLIDDDVDLTPTQLVEYAGGSISNLPVKTQEFKDWLTEQQKINPLVGKKHVEPAPEYYTDQIKMKDDKFVDSIEAEKIIEKATNTTFNPNDNSGEQVDTVIKGITGDDHDLRFIDMAIVENITKEMINSPKEDIIEKSNAEIKKYHNNDAYESEINIKDVIEQTEFLILEEIKEKLFLK